MSTTDAAMFSSRTASTPAGPVRMLRATCSKCGKSEEIKDTSHSGLPPEVASSRFRSSGWKIASRRSRDVCPSCATSSRRRNGSKAKADEASESSREAAPANAPAAENEATATPSDRRRISEELAACYRPGHGYDRGFSDHFVAEALDVPISWVEEVRLLLYGDDAANDDMRDLVADLGRLKASLEQIEEAVSSFQGSIEDIRSRLGELNERAEPILALVGRREQ